MTLAVILLPLRRMYNSISLPSSVLPNAILVTPGSAAGRRDAARRPAPARRNTTLMRMERTPRLTGRDGWGDSRILTDRRRRGQKFFRRCVRCGGVIGMSVSQAAKAIAHPARNL